MRQISPVECWGLLKADASAQLIDVRTMAEWVYVGHPELSGIGRKIILLEWQHFPSSALNPAFADAVEQELANRQAGRDAPLCFLCRSGVRSLAAARVLAERGYTDCINITGGFEGDKDENGHRGKRGGWKVAGLPWTQG